MKKHTIGQLSFVALVLLSLTACGSGKSASNAAGNAANAVSTAAGDAMKGAANAASSAEGALGGQTASMPNCGSVKPVWVNLKSRVYHEPDDPYYGKTRQGEYLCPSQAKGQGFHKAGSHSR
jgi:hypothetical protein